MYVGEFCEEGGEELGAKDSEGAAVDRVDSVERFAGESKRFCVRV